MDFSKLLRLIIMIVLFFLLFPYTVYAGEPSISAKAAILMDMETGEILYEKNAFEEMYPASTTKILTAILGLEMGSLNDIVHISENAAKIDEASIYLEKNHKVYLEDLIRGALIKSGNDAAYAIGEYIAGSESIFVMLMNKKAALLGGNNTNFINTNGLPNEKHKSTAYDLALMGRYAMQNLLFSEIVSLREDSIKFITGETRYLKNTNKLLWNYPYTTGIKTGTTRAAGSCLVASARKNNTELIAVVLKSQDRYGECIRLFEYGFENFQSFSIEKNSIMGTVDILDGELDLMHAIVSEKVSLVTSKDSNIEIKKKLPVVIKAPIKRGNEIGSLEIYIDGNLELTVPLVAQYSVEKIDYIDKLKELFIHYF